MKHYLTIGIALVALCSASMLADARPPTVMNSPGYDARLKESRSALGNSTATTPPAAPQVTVPKKPTKKKPAH